MFPATPADQLVAAVVRAEELGLDEVWIADEGVARDPMTVLAASARETSEIRLAVGITSPLLRHPGAIAATAATVDELSGGRFTLGLGVGGQKSLKPFGLSSERPVAMLRAADHAIGRRDVPIWVGSRGPQIVKLAARLADGVFLSGCTPAEHAMIVASMEEVVEVPQIALYQSASDEMNSPSVRRWADVGSLLTDEAARWHPASIGINLVDLNDGRGDPIELVERAAEILGSL